MSRKRSERWDPRFWFGGVRSQRFQFGGARQAAPENRPPKRPPVGPPRPCHAGRHGPPYAKRPQGMARRAARQWVRWQRAALLWQPDPHHYDDGWHAMG